MVDLVVKSVSGSTALSFSASTLIIAGWTARNAAVLEEHIAELEALGIARPSSVPMFYRVNASLLTTDPFVQVVGREGSGEVEAVLWKHDGELMVGVGSDHTDRKLEAVGVTLSKQLCAKPVSRMVWPWREVAPHWDGMILRSRLPRTGELYQEGLVAGLRRPDELLALYEAREGVVPDGTVMFCGTLPVHGGVRFAEEMALELVDATLGRTIAHHYVVDDLPIVEA